MVAVYRSSVGIFRRIRFRLPLPLLSDQRRKEIIEVAVELDQMVGRRGCVGRGLALRAVWPRGV